MKSIVDLLVVPNDKIEITEDFNRIAKELMSNYQIVSVLGEKFNIHEIEFYFYSNAHRDPSVHRHNLKVAQWRVHYSGVDITFDGCAMLTDICKNKKCINCDELSSYGGILIRSIGNSKPPIVGPLRVQTTLLTGGSISGSNGISLIKTDNHAINNLMSSTRCGVKSADYDKNYCFYNGDILTEKERNDGTKTRVAK